MRKHERENPAYVPGRGIVLTAVMLVLLSSVVGAPAWAAGPTAEEILEETGVQGGLVVHVGCGDGQLTAALRASDRFVVHGLDVDVTKARDTIRAACLYGPVSVQQWNGGALPYADNLVNLIYSVCGLDSCFS